MKNGFFWFTSFFLISKNGGHFNLFFCLSLAKTYHIISKKVLCQLINFQIHFPHENEGNPIFPPELTCT